MGSAKAEREQRRWRGVFTAMLLASATAAGLMAAAYSLLGAPADALVAVMTACGSLSIVGVFRAAKNVRVTQFFALSWFLVQMVCTAIVLGVMTYLAWLAVLMLVAFLVGGPRGGLAWALVVAVVLVATGLVMVAWPVVPTPVSAAVEFIRIFSLAPVLAAYGYLYEVARVSNAKELEEARNAAQQANEARGRLLSKVSHEIRTPLNGVLGLTQAVLWRPLPADTLEDLELIQESGAGLLALINDLLDIGRAEAGKVELHPTAVELGRLLTSLAALHRAAAELKGLDLRVEKGVEPLWVTVDESRFRQVVGNLVSNAIKFTASGHVTVRLSLGKVQGGRIGELAPRGVIDATIAVEDTGLGLDPSSVAELFQPFKQFHTTTVKGGTGLGLAISRELAHAMGGRLEVASEPGRGSRFCLHLSLEQTAAPLRAAGEVEKLAPFAALIVDDNPINRRVAASFVAMLGGVGTQAVDGHEAVRLAAESAFDVILMDLQMPGIDGLRATALIKQGGVNTPVVGVSAAVDPETLPACLGAGMVGCLPKPLQLTVLQLELSRLLSAKPDASTR